MTAMAIELERVKKSFGDTEIIRGIDMRIPRGERHALIGPNGAGKSTLFNLISGALAPTAGEIRLNGSPIQGAPAFRISRLGLSRSFQVTNLFHTMSVYENIRCAALWSLGYHYGFWRPVARLADATQRTQEILNLIHLDQQRFSPAGLLSYADQRALEIGVTIAGGAELILLDEPTAGMSHAETERAVALIRRISEGRTLMIVEHDMNVVFGLADRISVLVYGEIIACGSSEEIRRNREVRAAYLGDEGPA
jgi:branched-chain amino acid transport system ATP-binding protein